MINLKKSLLEQLLKDDHIKCARISISNNEIQKDVLLKVDHTNEDYIKFLNDLDVEVDDYDYDVIDACVWLEDVNVVLRFDWDEYDCGEYVPMHWHRLELPLIPNILL